MSVSTSVSQDAVSVLATELKEMGCPLMAARLEELYRSPHFFDLSPLTLLQEIVVPEYEAKATVRLNGRIRRANLAGVDASLDACQNSALRIYEPRGVLDALRTMRFTEDGLSVCVLGASGSGKTYYAKALALQACQTMKVEYHHCDPLLCSLAETKDISLSQYRKSIHHLEGLDLLVLDDFLLQAVVSPGQVSILFELLNARAEAHHSTIVCSQRKPESWPQMLGGDVPMADAIITRVTHGYAVAISLVDHN